MPKSVGPIGLAHRPPAQVPKNMIRNNHSNPVLRLLRVAKANIPLNIKATIRAVIISKKNRAILASIKILPTRLYQLFPICIISIFLHMIVHY
jgi:hypothetical protein